MQYLLLELIYYSAETKIAISSTTSNCSHVQSLQRRTKGKEKTGAGIIESKGTWQPECIELSLFEEIL